jgi:hypothetical protein
MKLYKETGIEFEGIFTINNSNNRVIFYGRISLIKEKYFHQLFENQVGKFLG